MNHLLRRATTLSAASVISAIMMPSASFAQDTIPVADFEFVLEALQAQNTQNKRPTMFGVPTAGVAPHGTFFGSATRVTPRGGVEGAGPDYDAALGFGLGDSQKNLGIQVVANITGTDPFADTGSFGLKFARELTGGATPTSAAISLGKVAPWGDSASGSEVSANLIFSHVNSFSMGMEAYPVILTGGYGNQINESGTEGGAFVGVGVGLTSNFGVSISATSEKINAGAGFSVPGVKNLSISAGINDITDSTDKRQATVSVSYSFANVFGG